MNLSLVTQHLTPESVLDIGANSGQWYRDAVTEWPQARFYLVEANPRCEYLLASLNVPYKIALLSDKEQTVRFYVNPQERLCAGASYRRELTPAYQQAASLAIRAQKLDDVTEGRTFDLIKLDTQGSELDILRGGKATVDAAKALVVEVSIRRYNEGAPLRAEVEKFLQGIGFTLAEELGEIQHPLTGEHIQTDCLYLKK